MPSAGAARAMRYFLDPILILALVALAFTNPTTTDYAAWVKQEIATVQNPLLNLAASVMADPIIQSTTRRQNFVLFSIFKTRLDGAHEVKTVGVASSFVPLPPAEQPNIPSQRYPHVIAAALPNTWKPEDGYVWVSQPPNGDFRVRWQPGILSNIFAHVFTTTKEGFWLPEDGYNWNVDPPVGGQLQVHWVPGKPSTMHPHVVAAPTEGRWRPARGYQWQDNPPSDFRVTSVTSTAEAKFPDNTLPDCSSSFVTAWTQRDIRIWPLPRPPKACIMHGETGAYRCEDGGCQRVSLDEPAPIERASTSNDTHSSEALANRTTDHGEQQYAADLACSNANPPCPRWWTYALRVSKDFGLPLCPLDFQRKLNAMRYYAKHSLPLTQACVLPGALTSTGPLRCDRKGCCKPGISCS